MAGHEVALFEREIGGRGDQQARADKPVRTMYFEMTLEA